MINYVYIQAGSDNTSTIQYVQETPLTESAIDRGMSGFCMQQMVSKC